MFNRRELLKGVLRSTPLVALAPSVPQFLTRTAFAAADAKSNKDKILVVVELAGGNDGLNMLVPYGDELYYQARQKIAIAKNDVIRIDDHMGLNPSMRPLEKLLGDQHLSFVQAVGYPNPNRSHFEAMDIWQSADPLLHSRAGWLGQAIGVMPARDRKVPALNLYGDKLPLALQGAPGGVPTIDPARGYGLELGEPAAQPKSPGGYFSRSSKKTAPSKNASASAPREKLIRELTELSSARSGNMADFVRRTALESYSTAERLKQILADTGDESRFGPETLARRLQLVARMIDADFGPRIYFVSIGSFDTHADQRRQQDGLLRQLSTAIDEFFKTLRGGGNVDRVLLMTFSEFGRRVDENGAAGTDHGSASAMILASGGVNGGLVGQRPRLDDLVDGDIKFQIDFRRVYATILDDWLRCDSSKVLGQRWEKVPLFRNV
jgi:uncharacterized protein (DUF1501 family)